MTTKDIIVQYLEAVRNGLIDDAAAKNQKIPVSTMEIEADDSQGKLMGAHYFKYLVEGRGPGKFPPPEVMEKFVRDNPEMLEDARKIWKNISEKSLAFLIGRKISRYGTDIFTGRKQGVDLTGVVEATLPDFLEQVAYYKAVSIADRIVQPVAA